MDTISRIAKILNTSEVVALRLTQMFDLPWATMEDFEVKFRLRCAIKNAK
jgi:hypothetical protein